MSQKSFSGSFSTPVGKREGGTLQEELQGLTWDGMLEKQRLSEKRRKSSVGTDPGSPSKAKANSQADGEHSGWVGPPPVCVAVSQAGAAPPPMHDAGLNWSEYAWCHCFAAS
jgi:hypothetical protein